MEVRSVILEVVGRSRDAQRSIQDIQDKVNELRPGATFRIHADVTRARRDVQKMREELLKVDRQRVAPEVSVQIGDALAKLAVVDGQLARLPRQQTIDIDIRRGILTELASVERGVLSTVRSLDRASRPAQSFGDRLGEMAQTVKALVPVLNGLAVIIGIKLVAGLIALAASAASAIGGILALGTAFAATLGPAVVLLLGVINRVAKVLEALKLQDQARDAAQRKTAEGSRAAAQAAEARISAEEGVRDALQGVTTAERALSEARRTALEAIRDAQQQAADSARGLRDAVRGLADQTTEAFRAMQDAAERVTQALFDVRDAKNGIEEARLAVRDIRNEIRKLGKSVGLTGGNLNSLITRATDVSFDPRRLRQLIGSFLPKDADQSKALEMEKLLLRLRDAKLSEDEANHRLKTSERDLARSREDNAKFQREGIKAYGPYRDAVANLERARREANDAQREANRLEQLGVSGAPAVIAAVDAIRDAEERLRTARRQRANGGFAGNAADDQERARQATDKLTAAEQKFLGVLKEVRTELSGFLGPAVDAVFGAMGRALATAPALLLPLKEAFTGLGQAWADVIDTFSFELIRPEWITALRDFTNGASDLARIVGGDIFVSFARIFRDIALVSLPPLISLMQDFAGVLRDVAKWSSDVTNTAPLINTMVTSFRAFVGLLGAIVKLFGAFILAAAPIGDEFVGWITDAVKALTEWLSSAEGQKQVRQFFEDTIPSVKALLGFIFRLGRVFLQLIQFISPFLEGSLSVLNTILDAFSKLLGFINDIVSNPWGRAIRFAIGEFLTLRTVVSVFNLIVRGITGVFAALSQLPLRAAQAGQFLVRPFITAAGTIRSVIFGAVEFVVSRFVSIGGRIVGAVRGALDRIIGLFVLLPVQLGNLAGDAATAVGNALHRILDIARGLLQPLIDIGHALVDGFAGAFRGLAGLIGGIFDAVLSTVKGSINLIIKAVNFVIDRINDIPNIKTPLGSIGIPDISNIPELARGGLITGPTLAALGEKPGLKEAVLPLTGRVMARLARALAVELGPGLALAGGLGPVAAGGGGPRELHNHFHIPRPLDSSRDPDPENTAALLQQAWEKRGGGLT